MISASTALEKRAQQFQKLCKRAKKSVRKNDFSNKRREKDRTRDKESDQEASTCGGLCMERNRGTGCGGDDVKEEEDGGFKQEDAAGT